MAAQIFWNREGQSGKSTAMSDGYLRGLEGLFSITLIGLSGAEW